MRRGAARDDPPTVSYPRLVRSLNGRQTASRARRHAPQAASPPTTPGVAVRDELRTLTQRLRAIDRDASDGLGLPPAQATVLRALGERPVRSLAELSRRVRTDPSSASVVVHRLVTAGLVARVSADDDRRRLELTLTAAGRGRLRRQQTLRSDRFGMAVATLDDRQVAALLDALTALNRALD